MKKDVYASTSAEPGVALVSATSIDAFRKSPIELRDKKVLSIEPDHVTKITVTTNKPATTQPTTREAVDRTVVIERNKQVIAMAQASATTAPAEPTTAPTEPTTAPTTGVASTGPSTEPATMAATQPAEPPAKWKIASADNVDADDTKVQQLLDELKPLRADKFLESAPAPTTQPAATYTLIVETTDARHEIGFTDPGDSKPAIAAYNGLTFEVARWVMERIDADFAKQKS
jgi:hypothetical protein